MLRILVLLALALSWSTAAAAQDVPAFSLPLDCRPGIDCFVQQYVDHDPGPGAHDYTCGTLSYDGLNGTDIRLPDYVAMERGVAVLAAADGVVAGTRDGMEDVSVAVGGRDALEGRDAGNGVAIDHGGGWTTQYSHMRKGSIAVVQGQAVKRGEVLGLVGLSGNTEFPHLNFTVRRGEEIIDPFVGAGMGHACGTGGTPLWTPEAAHALAYVPTALLAAGFAQEKPHLEAALRGAYAGAAYPADAPAIVFWVVVMGTQAGDREAIRLIGPDGAVLAEWQGSLDRPKAQRYLFAGDRRPGDAWPPGNYTGTYTLERGDGTTATVTRTLQVR